MMVELNLVNWFFVQQESNFEVSTFLKENHLVELILFLKKNGWGVIEDGLQVAKDFEHERSVRLIIVGVAAVLDVSAVLWVVES